MTRPSQKEAKVLQRVRELREQIEDIERALQADADSAQVMQRAVLARGAANSLMAELLGEQLRVLASDLAGELRTEIKDLKDLVEVLRTYLK